MIVMNITNGLILAGQDTPVGYYERFVKEDFKSKPQYLNNKFIKELRPYLISYGTEIIKKSLPVKGKHLHKNACNKIFHIYNTYHQKGNPFFIDNGGYPISIGKVPFEYLDHLIEHYTNFIQETCGNPQYNDMLYFFLDITPTNGITKELATIKMLQFRDEMLKKINNIDNALDKIYLVLHCNNEASYDTFYHLIRDNSLHEQIPSHKWSCGGLVPLNFNLPQYIIRPYMTILFDVMDLELTSLKNNIPIYFHILGTSSSVEMIMISWLNILSEYYNLPLIITFDSTTHINNAARSGIIHYINDFTNPDDQYPITCIDVKWNDLYKSKYNRPSYLTNKYYIDKIWQDLKNNLEVINPDDPLYDNNYRYTKIMNSVLSVYEAWAFSKVFDYIKDKCYEKRDWIINRDKRGNLKQLVVDIISDIDNNFIINSGRAKFNRNVIAPLINSLEWFEQAIFYKLPSSKKSYNLVKTMFSDNIHLMTNPIVKINTQTILSELTK